MFRDGASRSVPFEDGVPPSPALIKSIPDPKPNVESAVASSPPLTGLTPADVLGNPDCIMRPGAGRGRDLAMVVVPGEDGSRFAVVDGSGTVFSDTLPFPAVRDSSLVRSQVIFQPSGLFFSGDRSVEMGFFPTDGSEPRQLLMNLEAPGLAKFVSSNEGYFGLWRGDDLATVKREFRNDGAEVSVEERWSRDLSISQISSDGAWLVGHGGTGVHVLDASTGNTVFEHAWSSVDTSIRIHDGRLVLGHGVGDADDIARCRAKREVVSRTPDDDADGTGTIRSVVNVSGEKACLADLRARGLYRTVYDVYDLRSLGDGGSPDHYRVEYRENPHCGSGDDPFGTLEVRDDQLVYVPRT